MINKTLTNETPLKIKWITLGLAIFLMSHIGMSQPRYFKCTTATLGKYNWSTPANWYQDAACTINASIPGSGNDVVFGANTFTTNGQIVYFDPGPWASGGFSVNATSFTGCAFQGPTTSTLTVFGHFDISNLNTTNCAITGWNINVVYNPGFIFNQNVFMGNTKKLNFDAITIDGNITTYTVNFQDTVYLDRTASNSGRILVAPTYTNTNSVKVNFNKVVKLGFLSSYTLSLHDALPI